MSFRQRTPAYRQTGYTFKDADLEDKVTIHEQMRRCVEAFNTGDPALITNTVDSLVLLVTPDMLDDHYVNAMRELETTFITERSKQLDTYASRKGKARIPDLIPKLGSEPPISFNRKRFQETRALFERKEMLFKKKKDEFWT